MVRSFRRNGRKRGCTVDSALEGFTRQMKRLLPVMRRSMTYDRGSGMACHPELARRLKIGIWFCDPHTRWPRGNNESTNGQLAPFLPQGHRPWAPSACPNRTTPRA